MSDKPNTPTETASSESSLRNWAQLVRLPNVFTIIADVAAAFLLVAHGPEPVGRFVVVILAGIALYWGGMILNDVFDVARDRQARSERPLAAGKIGIGAARAAGWGCLVVGFALAAASGYLPGGEYPVTWFPAAIAAVLAVAIVLYNGPLKITPLAPAVMGFCRFCSFLLGLSPLFHFQFGEPLIPKYLFGIAVGFGTYVMGLTLMARREAVGGPSTNLPTGMIVMVLGVVMLAFAPQLARVPVVWQASPTGMFPILVGMIGFPVIVRAFRAVRDPSPARIQMTIRVAILSIIPLAAAYAFLGAGPVWGLVIFALVVPAMTLAVRLRVT